MTQRPSLAGAVSLRSDMAFRETHPVVAFALWVKHSSRRLNATPARRVAALTLCANPCVCDWSVFIEFLELAFGITGQSVPGRFAKGIPQVRHCRVVRASWRS